jgi:aminopeptidase N
MQTFTRLIEHFVPAHYDLSLTLNRIERTFQGTVTINGEKLHDDKDIMLHAKELTIESVIINGKEATFFQNKDELTVSQQDVQAGAHTVVVVFSGGINDQMHGLYPCYYDHDGIKKELLATQFESHHAREVFPCIDEPEAKAEFDVTLTTEKDVIVLGNMPVSTQITEDAHLVTTFETSPRMSTYLLAWVVGELQQVSGKTKDGVEVSIWSTPAQPPESLHFALDIAKRTIDFFNEYFGTPYPLPKSDHVALPDFSSGAMENWGLITYREVLLLIDPKTASLETRQQAALVIAHELSHQWFGNLVTMKWWNDLWLNESFANMMEYVAIDAIEPKWNVWLDFAGYEVIQALRRDSLEGVQAIQVEVQDPDEINSLFDPSIVYAKGGRLLRMLQAFIGDEAMQAGLKSYFQKFAYTNTQADDLWKCLTEASGQDIGKLMHSWIVQSGYPIVHVTKAGEHYQLEQEQFFIGEHQPSEKLWPVPLNADDSGIPNILEARKQTVVPAQSGVPLLNRDSTSHFVTHYAPELFAEVVSKLPSFSEIDRLKLLNEQILLSRAGIVSSASLIELLQHYSEETSEAVWGVIALAISELKKFVEDDDAAEHALKQFVGSLSAKQYERLGWEEITDEIESDTKLRGTILGMTLYSDSQAAVQKANELYQQHGIKGLDPNLRVGITAAVVRTIQDTTIIDSLLEQHASTNSSELQEDIAAALTSTRNIEVIERLLGLLKDSSVVRHQDLTRWFVWLIGNRYGRTVAWQWLRDNWKWLEETFSGDKSYDGYPRYVATILSTSQQLDEYKTFFTPMISQVALRRNIEVGITELTHRVALIEQDGPAVRTALLNL